jgi:hypothetical protein
MIHFPLTVFFGYFQPTKFSAYCFFSIVSLDDFYFELFVVITFSFNFWALDAHILCYVQLIFSMSSLYFIF